MTETVKGQVWSFDQKFGALYVQVTTIEAMNPYKSLALKRYASCFRTQDLTSKAPTRKEIPMWTTRMGGSALKPQTPKPTQVPIRMTVVKAAGGLLVYAPIAPTQEVVSMVRQTLNARHQTQGLGFLGAPLNPKP